MEKCLYSSKRYRIRKTIPIFRNRKVFVHQHIKDFVMATSSTEISIFKLMISHYEPHIVEIYSDFVEIVE